MISLDYKYQISTHHFTLDIFSTGQEPALIVAEDITEEKVDIIVPVVTLDTANSSPRLPVPVRHFIGEDLGTLLGTVNCERRRIISPAYCASDFI